MPQATAWRIAAKDRLAFQHSAIMADFGNRPSKSTLPGDPVPLDYRSPKTSNISTRIRRTPISGLLSFILLALFVPWAVLCFQFGWANDASAAVMWGSVCLPLLVATVFGAYSVKVAGIALRNILGVIGLVASVVLLTAILILFSVTL
jgi:hypothetical protein